MPTKPQEPLEGELRAFADAVRRRAEPVVDGAAGRRALELAGCIVTADALHCQKNIAKEIKEADAQYVLALKGNQGTAFAEVKAFLDDAIARQLRAKERFLTGAATHRPPRGRALQMLLGREEHQAVAEEMARFV